MGDIVLLSSVDPTTGEVVSFEDLVGCHGGLGGAQSESFILRPSSSTSTASFRSIPERTPRSSERRSGAWRASTTRTWLAVQLNPWWRPTRPGRSSALGMPARPTTAADVYSRRQPFRRSLGQPSPVWSQTAGRPPGPTLSTVLDFGRYAGWSFGQIARHDPDFLEWLARMDAFSDGSHLRTSKRTRRSSRRRSTPSASQSGTPR